MSLTLIFPCAITLFPPFVVLLCDVLRGEEVSHRAGRIKYTPTKSIRSADRSGANEPKKNTVAKATLLFRPVKYRTYSAEIPYLDGQPPPASTHIKPIYYTLKYVKLQYFLQKNPTFFLKNFTKSHLDFCAHFTKLYSFFSRPKATKAAFSTRFCKNSGIFFTFCIYFLIFTAFVYKIFIFLMYNIPIYIIK